MFIQYKNELFNKVIYYWIITAINAKLNWQQLLVGKLLDKLFMLWLTIKMLLSVHKSKLKSWLINFEWKGVDVAALIASRCLSKITTFQKESRAVFGYLGLTFHNQDHNSSYNFIAEAQLAFFGSLIISAKKFN